MASASIITRRRKHVVVLCAMVKCLMDIVKLWLYYTRLYSIIKSRNLTKKRKRYGGISLEETFVNIGTKLAKYLDGISLHLASIAKSLADDDKQKQISFVRKSGIILELQKLGLTSRDLFKAGVIIGGDESKLHNFFQLSSETRRQYVDHLLHSNGI